MFPLNTLHSQQMNQYWQFIINSSPHFTLISSSLTQRILSGPGPHPGLTQVPTQVSPRSHPGLTQDPTFSCHVFLGSSGLWEFPDLHCFSWLFITIFLSLFLLTLLQTSPIFSPLSPSTPPHMFVPWLMHMCIFGWSLPGPPPHPDLSVCPMRLDPFCSSVNFVPLIPCLSQITWHCLVFRDWQLWGVVVRHFIERPLIWLFNVQTGVVGFGRMIQSEMPFSAAHMPHC